MEAGETMETAHVLRVSLMRLARRLRRERTPRGLSLGKLLILGHLYRSGAMTPSELAVAERLQLQSLTRVLASLESDGLIARRQHHADRRQSVVEITARGQASLREDMEMREIWLAHAIIEVLSPIEQELLRLAAQIMDRLAEA